METIQFSDPSHLLEAARDRAPHDPLALTTRELLNIWGAQARGAVVVRTIRGALENYGLATDPDFANGYIDNHVRLVPAPADSSGDEVESVAISLKVGHLRAASQDVISVKPDDSIAVAETRMMMHDFSQLAVASTLRAVQGAISWESIGRKGVGRELQRARDACVPVEQVMLTDDLLPHLPRIASAGFVLVRGTDNALSGIVTTADVTEAFDALASPFLLLGEIERRLRLVIDEHFSPQDLAGLRNPSDGKRPVESVEDLSLGEIGRALERTDVWERLHWRADRPTFREFLTQVVAVRNRFVHFSPDPPTADEVRMLKNMVDYLKSVTS